MDTSNGAISVVDTWIIVVQAVMSRTTSENLIMVQVGIMSWFYFYDVLHIKYYQDCKENTVVVVLNTPFSGVLLTIQGILLKHDELLLES